MIKVKKYAITVIVLIVMVMGFFTGFYLYKINQIGSLGNDIEISELIEDECTAIAELNTKEELISASSNEMKTSPNCTIILKIYYQKCGHLVEKKEDIKVQDVNLTEEELKKKFSDWELQKFTVNEIVLYKEVNEFCGEHYVLKERNGNIAVFSLDENNNETFVEETDISTKYLAEEDLNKIRSGIFINSKKELNKTIEDFE